MSDNPANQPVATADKKHDPHPESFLSQKRASSTLEFPERIAKYQMQHGKVYWWPAGKFYVITDYNMSKEILTSGNYTADRSPFFISRMPNLDLTLIKDFFGVIMKMMVMSDPPEHTARRKFAAVGINNDLLDRYSGIIDKITEDLIVEAGQKGYIEFVNDIAEPLPAKILASLFCIDEKDRKDFYRWSKNMTQFFGGASDYRNKDGIEVNDSAMHIRDYFMSLIQSRKRDPKDDFLTPLLQNQQKFGLDDSEIVSQATMMLVAGQITTTDQIANNLYMMLNQAEAFARIKANPDLLPPAIEEFSRMDPGVTFIFREVKHPTSIGEQAVKPRDVIFIATHAVNRDPAIFKNPHECQIDRPLNPAHFSYGYGPHFCLGARLARIQMNTCFRKMLQRYPNLRLDQERPALRKHYSLAFSGFDTMHSLIKP